MNCAADPKTISADMFLQRLAGGERNFRGMIIVGDVYIDPDDLGDKSGCLDLANAQVRGMLKIHNLHMDGGCRIVGSTAVGHYDITNVPLTF